MGFIATCSATKQLWESKILQVRATVGCPKKMWLHSNDAHTTLLHTIMYLLTTPHHHHRPTWTLPRSVVENSEFRHFFKLKNVGILARKWPFIDRDWRFKVHDWDSRLTLWRFQGFEMNLNSEDPRQLWLLRASISQVSSSSLKESIYDTTVLASWYRYWRMVCFFFLHSPLTKWIQCGTIKATWLLCWYIIIHNDPRMHRRHPSNQPAGKSISHRHLYDRSFFGTWHCWIKIDEILISISISPLFLEIAWKRILGTSARKLHIQPPAFIFTVLPSCKLLSGSAWCISSMCFESLLCATSSQVHV